MSLTNAFHEAMSSNNVRRVRIMMKDSLLVDPTFREFDEMTAKAKGMEGLYDIHDGRNIVEDTSQWNDDYMDKLMVQIVGNFSNERIAHVKEVVKLLRPTPRLEYHNARPNNASYTNSSKPKHDYATQKRNDQREGRYIGSGVATGAVAGAAAGGIIASIAGVTVFSGAVVGAVAGGGIAYVATRGGK